MNKIKKNKIQKKALRPPKRRKKILLIILIPLLIIAIGMTSYLIFPDFFTTLTTKKVTISFVTNSDQEINPVKVASGTHFFTNNYTPVKAKHTFGKWYLDENFQNEYTPRTIMEDTTLYASWLANYDITFNSGAHGILVDILGEKKTSLTYTIGNLLKTPSVFVQPNDDYYFLKWSDLALERNRRVVVQQDLSVEAIYVHENDIKTEGIFQYIEDETFIKLVGCTSQEIEITIPEMINNKPIKVIGETTFVNKNNVETIIFNSHLSYIEPMSFVSCNKLTKIDTTNNNNFFFNQKRMLMTFDQKTLVCVLMSLNLLLIELKNIEHIEAYAFSKNYKIEKINLDSVNLTIDGGVFADCISLTDVIVKTYLEQVPYELFYGCKNLKKVNFGESNITAVGRQSFTDCPLNLTFVNNLKYIGPEAFAGNRITAINLKDIIHMGEGAFARNLYLENVTIDNLTEIPKNAFNGCAALLTIVLPDKLQVIDDGAFGRCSALETIIIPNEVVTIGNTSFIDCVKLANVTISKKMQVIGRRAFSNCPLLLEIELFNKDVELNENSFDQTIIIKAPKGGKIEDYCQKNGIIIK